MTFFNVFFRYILPATVITIFFWFLYYGFAVDEIPLRELSTGLLTSFISVVTPLWFALWAFSRDNVLFLALVMGSMPLRLLFVFIVTGLAVATEDIDRKSFVLSLLVFYFTYLYLEIYIFAKTANKLGQKKLSERL